MAISINTAGSWAFVASGAITVTLPTHATGNMLIVRVAYKSSAIATCAASTATAGWKKVGPSVVTEGPEFHNGTTNSGNGTGSVAVAAFWKIAESGAETNPQITFSQTITQAGAVGVSYQKASNETWDTPRGDGGGDTSSGTGVSATIQSHVSAKNADMTDFFIGIADDTTMTVPTFTQASLTLAAVSEQPATAGIVTTGDDMAFDGGYRLATAGTSSAAAVVTGTLSTSETGSAWVTVMHVYIAASFTADAIIKKETAPTFAADAVIFRTITPTFTADAVIRKERTATALADAVVKREIAPAATADAVLKATISPSLITNAVLLRTQAASLLADGWVSIPVLVTFTANAVKRAEATHTFTTDAVILRTQTAQLATNAIVLRSQSATFADDAILRMTAVAAITADATQLKTAAASFNADAVLRKGRLDGYTADANFLSPRTSSLVADAFLFTPGGAAFSADAVIVRGQAAAITADAFLINRHLDLLTVDAAIFAVRPASFTANAILSFFIVHADTFTADAWFAKLHFDYVTVTITAPSILGTMTTEATHVSASFTANAVIEV